MHQLAHALTEAKEEAVQRDLIDQAHDAVHELSGEWHEPAEPGVDSAPLVELLISLRADLRKAKQYSLADQVRQRLADVGIEIQDTPDGTVWSRKG